MNTKPPRKNANGTLQPIAESKSSDSLNAEQQQLAFPISRRRPREIQVNTHLISSNEFDFAPPSVLYLRVPSQTDSPTQEKPSFFQRHRKKIAGILFGAFGGLIISILFPPAIPFVTALFIKGASPFVAGSLITATCALLAGTAGAIGDYVNSENTAEATATIISPEPKTQSPRRESPNSVSPKVSASPRTPEAKPAPTQTQQTVRMSQHPRSFYNRLKTKERLEPGITPAAASTNRIK
jgi:hypothetical protein